MVESLIFSGVPFSTQSATKEAHRRHTGATWKTQVVASERFQTKVRKEIRRALSEWIRLLVSRNALFEVD